MPANDNHATRTEAEEDALFDAEFLHGDRADAITGMSMMPRARQLAFAGRCRAALLQAERDGMAPAELRDMERCIRFVEQNAAAAPSDAFRALCGMAV